MKYKSTAVPILALGVLLGVLSTASADKIVKTDGKEIVGVKIKWFETRGEYQVEGADGSLVPVAEADVESLEVAKPAGFDQAEKACAAKQYDAAIPVLEDIAGRYKRLTWDGKARELLASAYFGKQDFNKAVMAMSELIDSTPKDQITDQQYSIYWTALMGAQKTAILEKCLNDALAGESKTLAGTAYLRRGDLRRSEGKKEDAVMEYLRAAIITEEAREVHPEALFKAAELLDALRDPRADDLRKRIVSMYPDSGYARKLAGQM